MEHGGWKTESMAKQYVGMTSSGKAHGCERKRRQSYADATSELAKSSPEIELIFATGAEND